MTKKPWFIVKTGLNQIFKQPALLKLIYFISVIYAFNMIIWDYYQIFGEKTNLPIASLGIVTMAFSLAESLPQFFSSKLIKKNRSLKIFSFIIGLTALCVLGASILQNKFGFGLLIVAIMATGFSFPLTDAAYKQSVENKFLTTMCSFSTIMSILIYSLLSLFFGYLADLYGIFVAYGGLSSFILVITLIYFFNNKKQAKIYAQLRPIRSHN